MAAKREAVARLQAKFGMSERRACAVIGAEAHDWIEQHGGNPRLAGPQVNPDTPRGPPPFPSKVAAASIGEAISATGQLSLDDASDGGDAA